MIRAAGVLFLCGDSALFLRRGNGSDHPNEFCCPGGHLEDGETALEAAIRETREETGFEVDPKNLRPWTRTVAPASAGQPEDAAQPSAPAGDVDFTTFVCRLKEQFVPDLSSGEHDGYAWCPTGGPPRPLHPGVQVALDRLTMDELGVARAMAAGTLASPQRYENIWLFAIRITGTGVAYRHARKEFVWRDPSIYLTDDFLARCNGLAVIWEHPKSLLNGKEFTDRAIGAVMLPYLRPDRPDEVWGIAKVHDEEAAEELDEGQKNGQPWSTSPAVNFADPTENDRIKLEDGKVMLIEGRPSIIDHIAICPQGVWDKSGPPTGVESVSISDQDEAIIDADNHESESIRHQKKADEHLVKWKEQIKAGNKREAAEALSAAKESGALALHHLRAHRRGFDFKGRMDAGDKFEIREVFSWVDPAGKGPILAINQVPPDRYKKQSNGFRIYKNGSALYSAYPPMKTKSEAENKLKELRPQFDDDAAMDADLPQLARQSVPRILAAYVGVFSLKASLRAAG